MELFRYKIILIFRERNFLALRLETFSYFLKKGFSYISANKTIKIKVLMYQEVTF